MVYSWKPGAHIKVSADVAGAMCKELADTGGLTARRLLDANRPEDAPLHDAFEWDDGVAAELYREDQARHIINCLCVKAEGREPVRKYFNICRADSEYKDIDVIVKSKDDVARLHATVLNELIAIKKKYQYVTEFSPVWDAIEKVEVSETDS